MRTAYDFEFPPEQDRALRRARRLAWTTIVYLVSVVLAMYLVLGSSQAMKTAWIEDILSLIPPIVFLIATRLAIKEPSRRFPYGYHRVVSIAFLCASLALFTMGILLLSDALVKLVQAERPTIGGVTLFGKTIWLGWLMIPALLWSAIPAVLLGRAKLPLAEAMHDKVLHADAKMNKADWLTATAALVGILGIGLGFWWADGAAAALISLDILYDGFIHLKQVIFDLMNQEPKTVDRMQTDPLPERVRDYLKSLPWVADAEVRMREEGHVYFGEAFIQVARHEQDLPEKLEEAMRNSLALDWRLHDLALVPVISLRNRDPRR